jgi:hypothetical protein
MTSPIKNFKVDSTSGLSQRLKTSKTEKHISSTKQPSTVKRVAAARKEEKACSRFSLTQKSPSNKLS